jgi:hypothetical protein
MTGYLQPSDLHDLLRLDAETGQLFWRERRPRWFTPSLGRTAQHKCANWNAKHSGREALATVSTTNHRQGYMLGRLHQSHRVVFAMTHGRWPIGEVDHIDRNPLNNRPCNLREATRSQNQYNSGDRAGTSRFRGVSWDKARGKWTAGIKENGTRRALGRFDNEEDAARAYDAAVTAAAGEFARPNFGRRA